MSCVAPCSTCTIANFYSCLTCDSTALPSSTQYGTQCLIDPTWYIQLAGTCMLFIFIMFPLLRKRAMVLTKVFDIIQMVAYFKYIVGFIYYRHNYLYMEMRAMNPWNEGWKLLTVSGDSTIPVFLTEETFVNKLIRIASIWCGTIIIILIIGIIKSMCGDSKMQFSTFMSKNIGNTLAIVFNITIQDIAFFCAAVFYSFSLSSMMSIIFFAVAVLLSIGVLIMLIWQFAVINYLYDKNKDDSLYNYQQMFLYRMDYDLFQTYSLTNLPQHEKKIHRYSNLAMIDLFKKIGYAFLVASYLYKSNAEYTEQVYQILGFIVFFQLVWYVALPFDPRKEIAQLIINIIADLLLIAILVMPLMFNTSSYDLIYMILCLTLFGLALTSALLQVFLDLYTFIPYDLYNIGLTIIIEDKELLKELQRRKKEQEENERKIQQLKDEQERLMQELREKKTTTIIHKTTTVHHHTKHTRENDSEGSLDKGGKPDLGDQNLDNVTVDPNQFVYPAENNEDPDDELSKYRIDIKKKRKVYEFDKKKPFVYSNKVDDS